MLPLQLLPDATGLQVLFMSVAAEWVDSDIEAFTSALNLILCWSKECFDEDYKDFLLRERVLSEFED